MLPSCKKADPVPTTGDLSITITRPFSYALTTYYLYTEGTYNATLGVNPLRRGTFMTHTITSGVEQVTTTLTALNPGNYVFFFSGVPLSVQVTPGRLNTYDYSL